MNENQNIPDDDENGIPEDGVEIALDAPEKAGKPEKPERNSVGGALDDLKRQLQAEKVANGLINSQLQAERDANARNMGQARLATVESSLHSLDAHTRTAMSAIEEAQERGDFKTATAKMAELAQIEAQKLQLNQGRQALRNQVEQPPRQPVADTPESRISRVSPLSQAFLRERPEYVADARATRKLTAAHADALEDGHKPDTPEYFSFVEQEMDRMLGSAAQERAPPARQEQRRAPPASPVRRDAPSLAGQSQGRTIRLTQAEAEMADALGVTRESYARNKVTAEKARKIGAYANG